MDLKTVELTSFKIEIDDKNNLYEITYLGGEKELSFSKKEFTKEISANLLGELIGSRVASEELILKLSNELVLKNEEIEDLLEKLNEQDKFIEENRKKLE